MTAGGYQRPTNPAPASGPGALSRRTDGGPVQKLRDLPDAQYGEAATFRDLQSGAPLAQTPSATGTLNPSGGGAALTPPPGFDAPSQFPDMPVTAGADAGPGPGSEALGLSTAPQMDPADRERLASYLPALIAQASRPEASTAFRNYVRALRAQVL